MALELVLALTPSPRQQQEVLTHIESVFPIFGVTGIFSASGMLNSSNSITMNTVDTTAGLGILISLIQQVPNRALFCHK